MSTGFKGPIVHAPSSFYAGYPYRNGCGMTNSAEWHVFHDDFVSKVGSNLPAGWEAAIIDTGATLVSDTTNGKTGALLFDSDGAAEGVSIYLPKVYQINTGKKFFMEIRFQTEVADDTDVQFGLTDLTATTNPEDLWTTTAANVVSFGVLDGDATVGMLSDKSNSGTSVQLGTIDLVSATWHTLAIGWDGAQLTGWVNGQRALVWSSAVSTTVPLATQLAPFVGFRNGSTANNEGQLDYVRIVSER